MKTKEEIYNLDVWDKLKIYLHYCTVQYGLKYNFHVRDIHPTKLTETNQKGWGEPDKVYGNIELRYLWKNNRLTPFEEFDLWEWYWRFHEEINIG
jgi:hypothetical protein